MPSSSRPPPRGPLRSSLPRGSRNDRVERIPRRLEDGDQPLEVPGVERPRIQRRRHGRCPEVGRGVSGHALDHAEIRARPRHREPAYRPGDHVRVARAVLEQPIQRVVLAPPGPAPPGPLDRAGEHALVAGLHVDLRRTRHRGRRYRTPWNGHGGLSRDHPVVPIPVPWKTRDWCARSAACPSTRISPTS